MRKQRRSEAIGLMAMVLVGVCLAGCNLTSKERIAAIQQVVDTYQEQSENLDVQIAHLRNSIDELKEQIEANPDADAEDKANLLEFIEKRMAELDRAMVEKAKYDKRLTAWEVKLDEIAASEATFGDEVALLGEGIKEFSFALPAPFNLYGLLAGTVITGLGIATKSYRKKLKNERAVSTDLVGSVEKVLITADAKAEATRADLEDVLAMRLASETKKQVRAIKLKEGIPS